MRFNLKQLAATFIPGARYLIGDNAENEQFTSIAPAPVDEEMADVQFQMAQPKNPLARGAGISAIGYAAAGTGFILTPEVFSVSSSTANWLYCFGAYYCSGSALAAYQIPSVNKVVNLIGGRMGINNPQIPQAMREPDVNPLLQPTSLRDEVIVAMNSDSTTNDFINTFNDLFSTRIATEAPSQEFLQARRQINAFATSENRPFHQFQLLGQVIRNLHDNPNLLPNVDRAEVFDKYCTLFSHVEQYCGENFGVTQSTFFRNYFEASREFVRGVGNFDFQALRQAPQQIHDNTQMRTARVQHGVVPPQPAIMQQNTEEVEEEEEKSDSSEEIKIEMTDDLHSLRRPTRVAPAPISMTQLSQGTNLETSIKK